MDVMLSIRYAAALYSKACGTKVIVAHNSK